MRLEGGCPGRDGRTLRAEERPCPSCGYVVELFSDEGSTKCPSCGAKVLRAAPLSCAAWCSAADKCAAARSVPSPSANAADGDSDD